MDEEVTGHFANDDIQAVIPAYGAVKGYSLLGMARGMMGGAQGQGMTEGQEAPVAGNRKQRRTAA